MQFHAVDIWTQSSDQIASKCHNFHVAAIRLGQVDTAAMAHHIAFRLKLLGGSNLALMSQTAEDQIRMTVRHVGVGRRSFDFSPKLTAGSLCSIQNHSNFVFKYIQMDRVLLEELTGQWSTDGLAQLQSELRMATEIRHLHQIQVFMLFLAYWRGDLVAAEEYSRETWDYRSSRMPQVRFRA